MPPFPAARASAARPTPASTTAIANQAARAKALEEELRARENEIAEMHAENRRLAELADLASARASAAEAAPRGLEASEQATRIFLDRIFETPADLEGFLSTYYPAVARGATLRADRISALMNQPRSNLINLIRRRFPAREATNRHLLGG